MYDHYCSKEENIKIVTVWGYGLISEAKITGNLDEAEDEAEASPAINPITLHFHKGMHVHKGSFFASETRPYPHAV